jgi:hypothetical protein
VTLATMTGTLPITIESGDVERVVLHARLADEGASALRALLISLIDRGHQVEVVPAHRRGLSAPTRRVLSEVLPTAA